MVLDFDLDAVYARTEIGQRELVNPSGHLSPVEKRLLAAVTGLTPMRVFADLGFVSPQDAIDTLCAKRLIELRSSGDART